MVQKLFETRSHSWREAGLARQLSAPRASSARASSCSCCMPLGSPTYVLYKHREQLFGARHAGADRRRRAPLALGWQLARDIGRSVGPALFRRMDPGDRRHRRLPDAPGDDPVIASLVALRVAGLDRGRWPSAARSPRSSSVSRPSRRSATSSPASCCSRAPVPASATVSACRAAAGRPDRGRRRLARPALHDLRQRRGLDHGPQQRRAERRGHAAARARGRRPARPPAPPTSRRARSRRCSRRHVDDADARRAARSQLEEIDGDEVVVRIRRRRSMPADGPSSPTRCSPAVGAEPRRGGRGRRAPAAAAARRLSAWPRAIASATFGAAEPALDGARRRRDARPANAAPGAHAERRDVDLGAVALDRAHDGRGDLLGRAWSRRSRGSLAPASCEHARRRG